MNNTIGTYKIAIVDDEELFRNGLAMLINYHENFEVVLSACHGKDLLTKLQHLDSPLDLLICDLEMPIMDGVELTKVLSDAYPELKIAILSSHYDSSLILKMIEIGASAFMAKNEKPDELYATLINVIEKGFHYNDFVVQLIREKMLFGMKSKKPKLIISLTEREEEVLKLLCEQLTNKEIGEKLYISARTVEGYRKNLLEKTNSKNTAGLIIFAVENGYFNVSIPKFGNNHF